MNYIHEVQFKSDNRENLFEAVTEFNKKYKCFINDRVSISEDEDDEVLSVYIECLGKDLSDSESTFIINIFHQHRKHRLYINQTFLIGSLNY